MTSFFESEEDLVYLLLPPNLGDWGRVHGRVQSPHSGFVECSRGLVLNLERELYSYVCPYC